MGLTYSLRPISDRSGFTGPPVTGSRNPFEAPWQNTLIVLEHELWHLDADRVVLELDVREQDIRIDGTLRANARTEASPAVRLAFVTPDGPMQFATDRYGWDYADRPISDGWKQNARAIALGLEALRKVDRYGITRNREQYRGFQALPPGTGVTPTGMTVDLALEVIDRESGWTAGGHALLATQLGEALRVARANTHPDRNGGDRSRWNAVDEAEQVLNRAGQAVTGEEQAPPAFELKWDVMWCARHLEPFRAEWPRGAAVAMVKLLQAAAAMPAVIDAAHGQATGLPAALERFAPLCCFVPHEQLLEIYRDVEVQAP
jgi:hypothetical protein